MSVYTQIIQEGCKGSVLDHSIHTLDGQEKNLKIRIENHERALAKGGDPECSAVKPIQEGYNDLKVALVAVTRLKAKQLWSELGEIPTNDDCELEQGFLHFEAGTNRCYVWTWFETEFNVSVAKDLMYCK